MSGSFAGLSKFYRIVSDTKPTTRENGSALVIGDRWLNTTDNIEWFWNGTYFLNHQSLIAFGINNARPDPNQAALDSIQSSYGIFFHSASYAVLLGTNNTSNYYEVSARFQLTQPPASGGVLTLTTFSTQNAPANNFYRVTNNLNLAYPYSGSQLLWTTANATLTTVGTPSNNGHARFTFDYSLIYP